LSIQTLNRSFTMRITLAALLTLTLAACATTPEPAPAPAAKPVTAKPAEAPKPAPQCFNGDTGAFVPVGTKAEVSGVKVECKASSDGKNAVWQGNK
jgi:hypothetical protein